jgi:hypothetical protein
MSFATDLQAARRRRVPDHATCAGGRHAVGAAHTDAVMEMNVNLKRMIGLAALPIAALALAACGAAASPSPLASSAAPAAASPSPSADAASPSPSASAEASESAAPSDGASAEPSTALPSFSFPSAAAEHEALLPDEVCGQPTQKFSFSGETFAENADEETMAVLDQLGRTPEDVSMAVAAGTDPSASESCGAGIVRIQGASTDQIREVFLESAEQQGDVVEPRSIGGRDLFEVTSDGETQLVYFVGDAFVFVTAPDAEVEGLLDELP